MKYLYHDAVVVGSGAAGLSAAVRLKENGKNVLIVTEGINCGTSRNTGSDKQTYYKLSLGGETDDSVRKMAKDLFSGGAVDGDNALCEAALSVRCFMNLVELGVPFPCDRYGEYVGYKTDHDQYRRATSAGPLTSKYMTEALEKRAKALGIPILERVLVTEILKKDGKIYGITAVCKSSGELIAIGTPYVILATGGPAGIYEDSVYPSSQHGAMSLAIEAGASLQNLTEWQYGLASVAPRWNVSGTYMQVLPRLLAVDEDGNEHEFLCDYFEDPYEALSKVFLKGYQWPFDCKKLMSGSSAIDIAVFCEKVYKKRRVFLDFTKNPFDKAKLDFEKLSEEAYTYLKNADALFGTPIERLMKMNAPAVELYSDKGVDLEKDYLEISLCAQHHNGGISVDMWWMTDIKGLFAIGECAGTHGIARPGGSALNAGQVGALRATRYISRNESSFSEDVFELLAEDAEKRHSSFTESILKNADNTDALTSEAKRKMSDVGAAIRDGKRISEYLAELTEYLSSFEKFVGTDSKKSIYKVYRLKCILLTQAAVLTAMSDYESMEYSSRGSAMVCNKNGCIPFGFDDRFGFKLSDDTASDKIQSIHCENGEFRIIWRDVRALEFEDDFFENVWSSFRENGNIY